MNRGRPPKGLPGVRSLGARVRGRPRLKRRWRVQSGDDGFFDEIAVVIGKEPGPGTYGGLLLHAEMMDRRSMFVDVAGFCLWIWVDREGVARISMSEDRRPDAVALDLRDPALDKPRKRRNRKG